jgi:hypothetical protein
VVVVFIAETGSAAIMDATIPLVVESVKETFRDPFE